MQILIIGGTGGTGQQLIRQALEQGHKVTALARNPSAFAINHARLTIAQGDVLNVDSLAQAVAGQDAVLSALGVKGFGGFRQITLYSEGGRNIIRAQEQQGVRRFICVTSGGVEDNDPGFGLIYKLIFKPLLQNAYNDMKRFEVEVRASSLDWVIVRPTQLTDASKTGNYRVSPRFAPPGGTQISRADLADFMLKQLTDTHYVHGTPTLAY
ncbi:MAG: NAD-dependent epimerase/dehydratase family protein [Caldilinea sp. CFX5]|nr:NAD-dependent epimerase/dehydratase family protein [Caldilinea sp. CFX5]